VDDYFLAEEIFGCLYQHVDDFFSNRRDIWMFTLLGG
jgi:hypothetical protein